MRSERGSVTLWMVGLVMVVLAVGGVALDLWRGLAAYRQLTSIVDAAAVAAGSGIDEETWRFEGRLELDPARVEERVRGSVAAQDHGLDLVVTVSTAGDGSTAEVRGSTTVGLTLLAILVDGDLDLSATASAVPTLVP